MDEYKQSMKYSILNIAFKVFIIVFLVLFIIFYFKIDIFNLKFFKSKNHKDEKYVFKEYDVNRDLVNAVSRTNYPDKQLSDFYIKTAYNCCLRSDGIADVERLKTIISQGFRCLDFKLIYKNNTLHIENQPQNQTFYNALEIIDKHCFSNSYCNNNEDPVIVNIRLHEPDLASFQISQRVFNKLREMFQTLNTNNILDSKYSLLQKIENSGSYENVLSAPLSTIYGKMIVMCNYDYRIIEANNIDAKHDLLQYIHLNTYIPRNNNEFNSIVDLTTFINNSATYNTVIFTVNTHNSLLTSDANPLIDLNREVPTMIIPAPSSEDILSSLYNTFGYTFRAIDITNVDNFDDIKDQEIQIYNKDFNIVGSAYILKPINRRRIQDSSNEVNNDKGN